MSAALMAAMLIAGYGWIVSPHVAYLQAVQQYEPAVTHMVAYKSSADKDVSVKHKELETIEAKFDRLRPQFFAPTEATAFLGDLWTVAEDAGCAVRLVDLSLGQSNLQEDNRSDGRIVTRHRAKLVLRGRYDDVIKLLEELTQHSRKVTIDSCSFDLPDGCANNVTCDMTVAIWVISPWEGATGE